MIKLKENELKDLFDRIKPDEAAKDRMYNNVLMHAEKERFGMKLFFIKKAVPVLAMAVIVAGSLLAYSLLPKDLNNNLHYEDKKVTDDGNRLANIGNDKEGSNFAQDGDLAKEDAIAPLLNQFRLNDKHYVLLSDDLRAEYGLPAEISPDAIGEKMGEITDSPDKSLAGCEVFKYAPAGGEEILAVKTDNGYALYRFFVFESYNNNQDEDAAAYLKLYGINKAGDISKVVFIGHSEKSKLEGKPDIIGEITDSSEITVFYNYYSALKNSSDKYFEKLFGSYGRRPVDGGAEKAEVDVALPPDYVDAERDLPADYDGTVSNAGDMPDYAEDDALVEYRDRISGEGGNGSVDPVKGIDPVPYDKGDTPGSVAPAGSSAGNALANMVTVRIYNQKGIYFESPYYIDFGFISRYEVSEDFAAFLSNYIK